LAAEGLQGEASTEEELEEAATDSEAAETEE